MGQLGMDNLVSRKYQTDLELQRNQSWKHQSVCRVEGCVGGWGEHRPGGAPGRVSGAIRSLRTDKSPGGSITQAEGRPLETTVAGARNTGPPLQRI